MFIVTHDFGLEEEINTYDANNIVNQQQIVVAAVPNQ